MPPLRLYYNTNGLAHHSLADAIDLVADLGYDGLALTPDVPHLDPRHASAADVAGVAAHLRRRGLQVSIQTGARFVLDPARKHWPTLLDDDPAARARRLSFLVRCLDIGRDLGADVLSFWSGAVLPTSSASEPELLRRLADGAEALSAAGAARGLRVGLEPEPGMLVGTVAQYEALRKFTKDPQFGLAFDLGHAHCSGEGDPAELIAAHGADLLDVQVEDMRRGEHVHLAFGEGTLDLRASVAALHQVSYRGPVVVELSRDSHRAPTVAAAAITHLRGLGA